MLVVLTVGDVDDLREHISGVEPRDDLLRHVVVETAEVSYGQLADALDELRKRAASEPDAPNVSVAVDEEANGLVLIVHSENDRDWADRRAAEFARDTAVSTTVRVEPPDHDTACTSRTSCTNPIKAGVFIGKSQTATNCTMAFRVSINNDEMFLTAGHCGYSGSNSWYHPGYTGSLGNEYDSGYYPNGTYDVMVVGIPDSQNSDLIYGVSSSYHVNSYASPVQNESVCASLAASNAVKCGTISTAWMSWTSDTCPGGCTMYGGDVNGFSAVDGDSGAPIYKGSYNLVAIGVSNTASVHFARVDNAYGVVGPFSIY